MDVETKIAQYLLQIKAININVENFFIWSSGIKSPIYCDNRKTLSFPEIRTFICNAFVGEIQLKFPSVDLIAAVATGAIAHASLIANKLNLPLVYVRPASKGHGLKSFVEGTIRKKQKVVIIEDLISTGNSSKRVIEILIKNNCKVLGLLSIFTFEFAIAQQTLEKFNCPIFSLCNLTKLLEVAEQENYISSSEVTTIQHWIKDTNTRQK